MGALAYLAIAVALLGVGGYEGARIANAFSAGQVKDAQAATLKCQNDELAKQNEWNAATAKLNGDAAEKEKELADQLASAQDQISRDHSTIIVQSAKLKKILDTAPKGDARPLGPAVQRWLTELRSQQGAKP